MNGLRSGLRIVVFAKAPLPGQVKAGSSRRWAPARRRHSRFACCMRRWRKRWLRAVPVSSCAPAPAPGSAAWAAAVGPAVCWTEQGEGDLGARMARAASGVLAAGDAVVLIGTDCPALDAGVLRQAAAVRSRRCGDGAQR